MDCSPDYVFDNISLDPLFSELNIPDFDFEPVLNFDQETPLNVAESSAGGQTTDGPCRHMSAADLEDLEFKMMVKFHDFMDTLEYLHPNNDKARAIRDHMLALDLIQQLRSFPPEKYRVLPHWDENAPQICNALFTIKIAISNSFYKGEVLAETEAKMIGGAQDGEYISYNDPEGKYIMKLKKSEDEFNDFTIYNFSFQSSQPNFIKSYLEPRFGRNARFLRVKLTIPRPDGVVIEYSNPLLIKPNDGQTIKKRRLEA